MHSQRSPLDMQIRFDRQQRSEFGSMAEWIDAVSAVEKMEHYIGFGIKLLLIDQTAGRMLPDGGIADLANSTRHFVRSQNPSAPWPKPHRSDLT